MNSVLERNDLEELMAMATMADRDFAAERTQVIVVSSGSVTELEEQPDLAGPDLAGLQRATEEREAAEARHAHRLKLPRRPAWDERTTPEQLDAQERAAFVSWRRELASLEDEERLVLTPFEKNLEVWRQLWRVLERSDIMVQVVDARDPLLYRCPDLEAYAQELAAGKASLLLLNKADLLPLSVRRRWAAYFDKIGLDYLFWSAALVTAEHQALKAEAAELGLDWHELREARQKQRRLVRIARQAAARNAAVTSSSSSGHSGSSLKGSGEERDGYQAQAGPVPRDEEEEVDEEEGEEEGTRILDDDELLTALEARARAAVEAGGPDDPRSLDKDRRLMVGLVGYPNVGKSSTINALFGAKKTAVAPTPGKTKHFQTLIVSPTMALCDCPGLVMPKFARSKADMVVAGVIPIDRLTEMRSPIEIMSQRVGRAQIEAVYGLRLPPAPAHLPASTPAPASQVLSRRWALAPVQVAVWPSAGRALAMLRGWTAGSGLPDEHRTGRQLLRDFTAGKLLHCFLPPGSTPPAYVPLVHHPKTLQPLQPLQSTAPSGLQGGPATGTPAPTPLPSRAPPAATAGSQEQTQPAGSVGSQPRQGQAGSVSAGPSHGLDVVGGGAEPGLQPGGQAGASRLGQLDEADLDLLMGDLGGAQAGALGKGGLGQQQQQRRAEHKFHKKPARTKGNRGEERAEGLYDGAAMTTGKKGGLVRMPVYAGAS
ncbi:hypothetical protein QJQ45_006852 [Haematococcus lacustris]|nr:hypothetical protein QJQ45_006852 [Haematococcus lacustris]